MEVLPGYLSNDFRVIMYQNFAISGNILLVVTQDFFPHVMVCVCVLGMVDSPKA